MQKKILSVILTVAMLMSLFAAIPFGVNAQAGANATFDTQAEKDYYANGRNASNGLADTGDADHGYALSLPSIGGRGGNGGSAVRVAQYLDNGSFSDYSFKSGVSYTLSFSYKTEVSIKEDDIKLILLGINSDNGMGSMFWANGGSNALKWSNRVLTDSVLKSTDGNWVEKKLTFTPSSDTQIAIAPSVGESGEEWGPVGKQVFYIDDLDVTVNSAPTSTFIDFEDEATQNWINEKSAAGTAEADEVQGNAAKLITMVTSSATNAWPSSVHISAKDANGNICGFEAKAGATYDLSLKMKIDTLNDGVTLNEFYILYASGGNKWPMSPNSVNDYSLKSYLWCDSYSEKGVWRTVRFNFTVPENIGTNTQMYLLPVVSSGWIITDQAVWIDDIQLAEISCSATSTDFENTDSFYNSGANANYTLTNYGGVALADTGDETHGKAIKITKLSATSYEWPQSFTVPASDGVNVFHAECEATYRFTFDIKAVTLTSAFSLYAMPCTNAGNLTRLGTVDSSSDYSGAKYKIYDVQSGSADWKRVTVDVKSTAKAKKGSQYPTLVIIPFADSEVLDQEVYIDNLEITRLTEITTHNGAEDGKAVYALPEAQLSSLGAGLLAGADVKQWYYDEALTQPASGKVGIYDRELWATFESVDGDFENGNVPAGNIWSDNSKWQILPFVGTDNSTAITNKSAAESNTNATWPQAIRLLNSDGSVFKTTEGHEYSLEFDIKVENPSEISDWASLGIAKAMPPYESFTSKLYGYFDENDEYQYLNDNIKYAYQDGNGNILTEGHYIHKSYTITAEDGNTPVIIVPMGITTPVYIDNIRLTDLTMQKTVKDSDGNVLAKGYIGEKAVLPEADSESTDNFVWWAAADDLNTPISELEIKKDTVLTAVTSQLAVTSSTADGAASMLSLTAVYTGLEYTEADGRITLGSVELNGKRRVISEIGILAAPDTALNGKALTLENYAETGALRASNSEMKYSDSGDGKIFATAVISTKYRNSDFTVVAYIKTADGKVLYSKTKQGIARNIASAAGLEAVDEEIYSVNGYSLVSNTEFNTGDTATDVFEKWHIWGQSSTSDSGVTSYSNKGALSADGEKLVMTVSKTDDNTAQIPYILSDYRFTTGYLEVKAKFSSNATAGGCIWLNSAAVKSESCKYPVTDADRYVFPEIDIAEFSTPKSSAATLHSWGTSNSGAFGQKNQIRLNPISDSEAGSVAIDLSEWHTYGLERTADYIRIFIDGEKIYEYTLSQALANKEAGKWAESDRTENEIKALFENETYLILSAGDSALKTGDTSVSYVDYVRFYK